MNFAEIIGYNFIRNDYMFWFVCLLFFLGKSKVQQGASSDPAGARSEALGSSRRVLHDQGVHQRFRSVNKTLWKRMFGRGRTTGMIL